MTDRDLDTGRVYPEGRAKRVAFLREQRRDLIADRRDARDQAEWDELDEELHEVNTELRLLGEELD